MAGINRIAEVDILENEDKIMVQLKYFGDSRDFFKYDLITSVITKLEIANYAYIPMLTYPRDDNEGRRLPQMVGGKSEELLLFINDCASKSLDHWRQWLGKYSNYRTCEPADECHFDDNKREEYWEKYDSLAKERNALIFLDPDTGLQTGSNSYLSKMGREKYLLTHEKDWLAGHLDASSILMVYQHLPHNRHHHEKSAEKKMAQLKSGQQGSHVCAYRENDLAFLFMAKDPVLFKRLHSVLERYSTASGHRYKSLHPISAL